MKNKDLIPVLLFVLFSSSFMVAPLYLYILGNINVLNSGNSGNRSIGLGTTAWIWNTTQVVSTESTSNSYNPTIAVDGSGNVHVAWGDSTDYNGAGTDVDIFYKFWNASTGTWNATQVVSTESTGSSSHSSIAVDGSGNVHVAWYDVTNYGGSGTDIDIFYKFWNASTDTWNTTQVVSTESTGNSYNPTIAVDGSGNVHVAWEDRTDYAGAGTDYDIFYKFWNASTDTWNTTQVVSTESTAASFDPTIAADGSGNVHVAWQDPTDYGGSGTDSDIFYKFWNASTDTWNATQVVSTESTGDTFNPTIAADGSGNVHVAWYDPTDYGGSGTDSDIFYKFWNASTDTWNATQVVSTESTGSSQNPDIAVDGSGNVHVAWHDNTNYSGSGADYDIFYKSWDASTDAWSTMQVVSTESTGNSNNPVIAVENSSGTVHVAWYDVTNYGGSGTDADIFYKRAVPVPNAPVLDAIVPNPDGDGIIDLNWNDVDGATVYYVYRNTSAITSVAGMTPIAVVSDSKYSETLTTNGIYYYVIVAANSSGNSTISNCESVTVSITAPTLPAIIPGFTWIALLLVFIILVSATFLSKQRKNSMPQG